MKLILITLVALVVLAASACGQNEKHAFLTELAEWFVEAEVGFRSWGLPHTDIDSTALDNEEYKALIEKLRGPADPLIPEEYYWGYQRLVRAHWMVYRARDFQDMLQEVGIWSDNSLVAQLARNTHPYVLDYYNDQVLETAELNLMHAQIYWDGVLEGCWWRPSGCEATISRK